MSFWNKLFGAKEPSTKPLPENSTTSPTKPSGHVPAKPTPDLEIQLIKAVKDRDVEGVQTLLAAGASANAQAKFSHHVEWRSGMAPAIHFALPGSYEAEEPCLQIIDLLLKSGADVDAPGCDGWSSEDGPFTPLMNAVQRKRAETVARLIAGFART